MGTLYKRYANGTQSLTGNVEKDQAWNGVIGAIPMLSAAGASVTEQGDENGFRTQGGMIANKAMTGMSIGSSLGKSFGPVGTLIGGAVGTGYGALSGLISGRNAQKKWRSEQEAMATARRIEDDNLSSAKIAGDPSLVLGNRYKEMYRTGGSLTTPKTLTTPKPVVQSAPNSDPELDTMPSYMYYLKAAQDKNVPGMQQAIQRIKANRGIDTAASIENIGRNMGTTSLNNLAKRNISTEQDPQMRKLYAMINENPDLINNFEYFMPDKTAQPVAKMGTGGKVSTPSLAGMYMNGGYAKPTSSGTTEIVGNSHEQGGVKVPSLSAELENGESTSGDFVFSEELGFAQQHKPIAKAMGKIEKKPQTRERVNAMKLLKGQENKLALAQEYFKAQNGIQ